MKKYILVILLSVVCTVFSQEKNITVNASVIYKPKIKLYEMQLFLSLDNSYNSLKRFSSKEELKKDFLNTLQKEGVARNKFREAPLDFVGSYGYTGRKNTVLLILETTDKKDLEVFYNLEYPQARVSNSFGIVTFSDKQRAELTERALNKAKKIAELTAKKMNVKLGEIESASVSVMYDENYKIALNDIKSSFSLTAMFTAK